MRKQTREGEKSLKCSLWFTRLCDSLQERVQFGDDKYKKGFGALILTDMTTCFQYFAGVVYRKDAKDNGLVINFCPWCGEKLGSEFIDRAKKRAAPHIAKIRARRQKQEREFSKNPPRFDDEAT